MGYTIEDENHSQSANSPGAVMDAEYLLRTDFAPEHIDHNGKLVAAGIATNDLRDNDKGVKGRGVSIDREQYIDNENIKTRLEEQSIKNPEIKNISYIGEFLCGAVRDLIDSDTGERAFLVIDKAIPENIAHACIYNNGTFGKGKTKFLRNMLLDLINNNLMPFTDYVSQSSASAGMTDLLTSPPSHPSPGHIV